MKLRNLALSALVFTSGVALSGRVRHTIANLASNEPLPYVNVSYSKDGAFVNGQRVYGDRIGEPRCDWDSIDAGTRLQYTLSELQHNNQVLPNYLRNAPAADIEHVGYASLVQLARREGNSVAAQVDSMRQAIGFRWSLDYGTTIPSLESR